MIEVAGQSTRLGLPDAVNATPSLAVAGRTVAAVWTTSKEGAGSARIITVVWSKRNEEGPQRARRVAVRMARSTDGGHPTDASRRV